MIITAVAGIVQICTNKPDNWLVFQAQVPAILWFIAYACCKKED